MSSHDPSTSITVIDRAIDGLQRSIEATRVPGELAQWLSPLRIALAEVRRVLTGEALPRHRRDFAQIAKDMSLIPRVDQMKVEDAELLAAVREAEALAGKAAMVLKDSNEQEEEVTLLAELGKLVHAIVIRLRAQEQAIDTWFAESINRDEGVSGGG